MRYLCNEDRKNLENTEHILSTNRLQRQQIYESKKRNEMNTLYL